MLFFIELDTRRAHLAGGDCRPDGSWITQQARNLLLLLEERGHRMRFLIRDRDTKFSCGFDDVFRSERRGAGHAGTGAQRQRLRLAYAEQWVRTVRSECLDWPLITGRGHLEQVLRAYVEHYNAHRPHRALELNHQPRLPV